MIIAFMRHGQTNYNKHKLISGHDQISINKTGFKQIKKVAKFLKRVDPNWDILGTTSLIRTQESAAILYKTLKINKLFLDDGFIERDFGVYSGKSIMEHAPIIMQDNFFGGGFETHETLINRVAKAIAKLKQTRTEQKILFVTHSHTIRALMILANQADSFDNKKHGPIKNSSVYYFDLAEENIKFLKKIEIN